MKSVSGKEFAKVLERYGWSLLRIQGSHHIYAGLGVKFGCPSPFAVIRRSKQVYSAI